MRDAQLLRIDRAIGVFALLFVAGLLVRSTGWGAGFVSQGLGLAALAALVVVFWLYLESKGRSGFLSFLALIPIAGALLLILLPGRKVACPSLPAPAEPSSGEASSLAA